MKFGEAIDHLNNGKKVARKGWNGKGMFLFKIKGTSIAPLVATCRENLDGGVEPFENVDVNDTIAMFTAQKTYTIGWLASQSDIFAEDWILVE